MIETIESLPGAALVQDYEVDNEPFLAKLQLKVGPCVASAPVYDYDLSGIE
jgi:hypothetical protein